MALSKQEFSVYIKQFNFRELFNDMGWNNDKTTQPITIDNETYTLQAVAEKSGFKILILQTNIIPGYAIRKKIETKVTKLFQEHLIIFFDIRKTEQIWQLAVRQAGKPTKVTETQWYIKQEPELLYQRAAGVFFEMDEEEHITIIDVTRRMSENFQQNNERVTKAFYDRFKKEHDSFQKFIKGISEHTNQEWYASLMLNRLMFCYFIQKRGFLDNNKNYLRDKLDECKQKKGEGKFYSFYRNFLLVLFHKGLNDPTRTDEIQVEIGKIPYLNGGLFDEHELEKIYTDIDIDDKAFENLFNFFDQYEWHLDTRNTASGKDINPDVIGYIFEKYINDRANMGAYYTKEDITDYISKNCIIPYLFDETARNNNPVNLENLIKITVQTSGDRYIYDAVKKGIELPLPEKIETGIDTTLPNLRERRKEWNKPASIDYALPTEIWREVVARRQRYAEVKAKIDNGEICTINDFITYNLNIRQFAQDVVENTNDPEFLEAFYRALTSVTILDPTCGSGAFLFAAMNILESLYEACIQRMKIFVEEAKDEKNYKHLSPELQKSWKSLNHEKSWFRLILENIQSPQHPNLSYFIYKSIILNNLYGVDIMNEAVEIAKLRLFLKLVATVEADYRKPNLGLEPLPDIDFNIRVGNTLVGFATENELEKNIIYGGDAFAANDFRDKIKEKCEIVAMAFNRYKEIQLKGQNENFTDFKTAKDELNSRLKALNTEMNKLLHKKSSLPYDKFIQTHQPFHWFAEFYEIINGKEGFDVIIGNPPYVEYPSDVNYSVKNFTTLSCGNLYAFVLERVSKITKENSKIGQITPVSIISTPGYKTLRQLYLNLGTNYFSSYNIHPCCLFEGAYPRLVISITHYSKNKKLFVSNYNKWLAEERIVLFDTLKYAEVTELMNVNFIDRSIPKINNNISKSILRKFQSQNKKMSFYFENLKSANNRKFYYRRAFGAFVLFYDFIPEMYDDKGKSMLPTELKQLSFRKEYQDIILGLYYSNLYYFSTYTFSDCRNINKSEIEEFYIDLSKLSTQNFNALVNLSDKLHNDLIENSVMMDYNYKTGRRKFQAFYPRLSKPIIDEIDTVLAQHYGFTEEELDFIINYDIKYRMGKEINEDE